MDDCETPTKIPGDPAFFTVESFGNEADSRPESPAKLQAWPG